MIPYRELRRNITVEAERKLLDEVMGDDGVIVELEKAGFPMAKRYLLIRVEEGKAVVVAGPLKENQLVPSNPIPERVERHTGSRRDVRALFARPESAMPAGVCKKAAADKNFHDWMVLGKTEIKDQAERRKLVDALRLGAEDNAGMAAACFIPRTDCA